MQTRPCIAASLVSVVLLSSAASAAPAQALPATASQPAAVLHANSNLVLIDVVVTERGNPVQGLDRSLFHLLEDGREQPIASFDEHKPAEGVHATPTAAPVLPAHTYTNLPVYPAASAINVLLLDGLNTPIANQMDVRHKMIEYLGKIPPGTTLAIFSLASPCGSWKDSPPTPPSRPKRCKARRAFHGRP